MRLLVTGKTGQLARALEERGPLAGTTIETLGRPEFDLADPAAGLEAIKALAPDAIISAAAYTAVDKAESEPELAERVNARGPAALASTAAELGIPIVHLSTDYVFDGTSLSPYTESDATHPQTVYGATKLRGEEAVRAKTANHAILRTAWVTSPWGQNFAKTMLRHAGSNDTVRVVADQWGNPTSALALADAVLAVAASLVDHPHRAELRGTFHAVGHGEASWADLAAEIFRVSSGLGAPAAEVVAITTADYPTPARRPANSRLDTGKLASVHGVVLPQWQVSLAETVRRLVTGELANGRHAP